MNVLYLSNSDLQTKCHRSRYTALCFDNLVLNQHCSSRGMWSGFHWGEWGHFSGGLVPRFNIQIRHLEKKKKNVSILRTCNVCSVMTYMLLNVTDRITLEVLPHLCFLSCLINHPTNLWWTSLETMIKRQKQLCFLVAHCAHFCFLFWLFFFCSLVSFWFISFVCLSKLWVPSVAVFLLHKSLPPDPLVA